MNADPTALSQLVGIAIFIGVSAMVVIVALTATLL